MGPRFRLVLSLAAVAAVFMTSTIGYHPINGASLGDSAHMTVITLSTVGYREIIEPADALIMVGPSGASARPDTMGL